MLTSKDVLVIAVGLVGMVIAAASTLVASRPLALALVVVGVALAFSAPLSLFGVDALWWGRKDERSRAIYYRSAALAWYVTVGALIAGALSTEYLPSTVSLDGVLWGLLIVVLFARVASRAYFARTM